MQKRDHWRLVLAALLPVVAGGLQWFFWGALQPSIWFLFYPAVFFSSWVGGLRGGLVATALSTVLACYFFIPPRFSFTIEKPETFVAIGIFVTMGILFSYFHERLRQANKLAADAQFRALFEQAAMGMTQVGLDGRFQRVNQRLCDMLGYPREELLAKTFQEITHPDDLNAELALLRQVLAGEIPTYTLEKRYLRKDQSSVTANLTVALVRGVFGEPGCFISVVEDITERKRAETLVRENRAKLETALASMTDAVFISDVAGQFIDFNDAFATFHRFKNKAECAKTFAEYPDILDVFLPNGELAPVEMWAVPRALRGETATNAEYTLRRKDTGETWVGNYSFGPIRDPAGVIVGSVVVGRDVTELKRVETARRASDDRMHLATEATGVGIWEWNVLTNKIRWDAQMFRIYGVTPTPDGFVDYTLWSGSVLPEELAQQEAILQATARRGGRSSREFRIRRRDDRECRQIEAVETVRLNERGQAEWVVGTNLDVTERKRAEVEMRRLLDVVQQEKDRLSSLVNSISDEVWFADTDKRFTLANPSALREFGLEGAAGVAVEQLATSLEVLRPDGTPRPAEEAPPLRALKGEMVRDLEEMIRSPASGELRYRQVSSSPVRDARGAIIGSVSVVRDITERKRAEHELIESEQRYRALFENMSAGFVLFEVVQDDRSVPVDLVILAANEGFEITTGLKSQEVIGKRLTRVLPGIEKDAADWIGTYGKVALTGESRYFEQASGLLGIHYSVSAYQAGPKQCAVTFVDITERKRAEAALQESEERFRTMANSMLQLAWIARADGFILWYNQRWYDYTGTTPEQMEGWGWQSVHDPKALPIVMENWKGAIASERPFEMEFPLRGADGRFRSFLTRGQPLRDSEGRVVQWFGTNTDVDDLKQAEEKVRLLNAELEQRVSERTAQLETANKELEAFSYSVSHDLRAPLRHVHGYVEMLAEEVGDQLSEKSRRYLKIIADASSEMGELIDDLLAFSRMGRAEMQEISVELDTLVREALRGLESTTSGRNIVWKIPPLPAVQGDPAMLKQVFANLLGNAVKYTRPRDPAQIEVGSAGKEDGRIILFVRDNGVGFDPQFAHKLFGVFQRLHRADQFEGTGIGLANVRRIIARHGGRTWAEGKLNEGATFYFTLKPASIPFT